MWKLKYVEVVPIVKGAFGSVTKDFERWIKKVGIAYNSGAMQNTALLGTASVRTLEK